MVDYKVKMDFAVEAYFTRELWSTSQTGSLFGPKWAIRRVRDKWLTRPEADRLSGLRCESYRP
jgi:hypothetical protein